MILKARAATVAEAMITAPKIHPADTTVEELRRFFADDHVHVALLVRNEQLLAVCERADLLGAAGAELDSDQPAYLVGRLNGRVIHPRADLREAARFLISTRRRRLAVVDSSGRLVGLLCLKRSGTGFCSDTDVSNRAAAAAAHGPPKSASTAFRAFDAVSAGTINCPRLLRNALSMGDR